MFKEQENIFYQENNYRRFLFLYFSFEIIYLAFFRLIETTLFYCHLTVNVIHCSVFISLKYIFFIGFIMLERESMENHKKYIKNSFCLM